MSEARAAEKAKELLLSHLTPSQAYTFKNWAFFYVRGSDNRLYGLWDGLWIVEIQNGRPLDMAIGVHAAAVPRMSHFGLIHSYLPLGDLLLLQKLALETNAKKCRKIACGARGLAMPQPLREGKFVKLIDSGISQAVVDDAIRIFREQMKPKPKPWWIRLFEAL